MLLSLPRKHTAYIYLPTDDCFVVGLTHQNLAKGLAICSEARVQRCNFGYVSGYMWIYVAVQSLLIEIAAGISAYLLHRGATRIMVLVRFGNPLVICVICVLDLSSINA